jgi:hypothetical protein
MRVDQILLRAREEQGGRLQTMEDRSLDSFGYENREASFYLF